VLATKWDRAVMAVSHGWKVVPRVEFVIGLGHVGHFARTARVSSDWRWELGGGVWSCCGCGHVFGVSGVWQCVVGVQSLQRNG
jgi:hypothetical protein